MRILRNPDPPLATAGGNLEETPEQKAEAAKVLVAAHEKLDKYQFKLPQGAELPDEKSKEYRDLAKKHQLSPEAMQLLYDREYGAVKGYDEGEKNRFEEVKKGWKKGVMDLPEYKAKPDDLARDTQLVKEGLQKYGAVHEGIHLNDLMDKTGFGDHPAVFLTLRNIFRANQNDTLIPKGAKPEVKSSPASEARGDVGAKTPAAV